MSQCHIGLISRNRSITKKSGPLYPILDLLRTILGTFALIRTKSGIPVFPTRPSLDERARPDGRLGKIARPTPVFLWFCPSICDFGHVHERYWAVWQTGQQRFQRALNHKKTTKSLKPEFCPSLRPSNARIFVQKAPVFRPSFYKNEPVWRIGNTGIPYLIGHTGCVWVCVWGGVCIKKAL